MVAVTEELEIAPPIEAAPALAPSGRLPSVDILRGVVIALMTLDHVRAYFTNVRFIATDLSQTTVPLFLTRWVTHFCAPTFVLLAGTSAWMAGRRRTRKQLGIFLLTRGLWLVALEFSVVSFAWYFNLSFELGAAAQVIWAIGASMVALAGLIFLPLPAIATIALLLIAGHNLLDGISPADLGALGDLWTVLHVQARLASLPVFVGYPLVPWIGVMAAGYVLGAWLEAPPAQGQRARRLAALGGGLALAFVVLRALNIYGDPSPWSVQDELAKTVLSFLNVTKYPPSLLYLLMTLGPALVLLAWLEGGPRRGTGWFRVLGRVPLFYYVLHLYLIHALAVTAGVLQGYAPGSMMTLFLLLPKGYGFGLPVVYLTWAAVVAGLYPVCYHYAEIKRNGRGWWWSYL